MTKEEARAKYYQQGYNDAIDGKTPQRPENFNATISYMKGYNAAIALPKSKKRAMKKLREQQTPQLETSVA